MASFSVTDKNWTHIVFRIADLMTGGSEYDKFVFRVYTAGSNVLTYDAGSWGGENTTLTFTFNSQPYLGNNWFSPATTYTAYVDCYYNGQKYTLNDVVFTTDAPTAPSGSISPAVYPTIKDQGSTQSCVADAITSAFEIAHAKAMGRSASYANYSPMYFFGTESDPQEAMNNETAVNNAVTYGAPRWELVETSFPQHTSKAAAQALFNGRSNLAGRNAIKQSPQTHPNVDFYDTASVKSYIQQYGFFLFTFHIPQNFYSIPSSGIVPQPNSWSGSNHMLCLIGLTTINGKAHWIGVNSWGTSWGASGLCYIPYDWGCGAGSPMGSGNTDNCLSWTTECYALRYTQTIDTNHPSVPTITKATKSQDGLSAVVEFQDPTGGGVLIYARQRGTTAWYPKTPTGTQYGYVHASSPATIQLDNASLAYEVSAIAVGSNNLLSLRSATVTVNREATDNVRIYNGGWKAHVPYIWTGSRWQQAQVEIHDGGGFNP